MFTNNIQNVKVQPPQTKHPLPKMSICRFEIRASDFPLWRNVPASATFVCYQRKLIESSNFCYIVGVLLDGAEPVLDSQVRAFEIP